MHWVTGQGIFLIYWLVRKVTTSLCIGKHRGIGHDFSNSPAEESQLINEEGKHH